MNQSRLSVVFVALLSVAAGCGDDAPSVGGACTDNAACGDGLTCDTTVAGGYCTKACTMTGETSECPAGAICDSVAGAAINCVQICDTSEDCRAGFECNGVSGSNVKACKPNDDPVADAGVPDAGGPDAAR